MPSCFSGAQNTYAPKPPVEPVLLKMTSRRGVVPGKMHLVAALIPQVHPFIDKLAP